MQQMPYSLMAELEKVAGGGLPPVHLWTPEVERDIDLVIKRDGTWTYQGTPIKRPRLVRLFASVLKREGEEYFLVTPVEKCHIQVEDVPFQIILMTVNSPGKAQRLVCTTDMAEVVTIDREHPLRVAIKQDQWIPYMTVRGNMEGRLTRNVYYQLAELLVTETVSARGDWSGIWSAGEFFPMMAVGED